MADIIKEIDDKFIAERNFDATQIITFIRDTEQRKTAGISRSLVAPKFSLSGPEAFILLNDTGNGRLSQGVASLEMMSRVLNGVPLSSLSLFDAEILFYSPDEIKDATDETARIIVLTNLGVVQYYNSIKDSGNTQVAKYNVFMDDMVRQIRAGSFRISDNLIETLEQTKIIIRLAMNIGIA